MTNFEKKDYTNKQSKVIKFFVRAFTGNVVQICDFGLVAACGKACFRNSYVGIFGQFQKVEIWSGTNHSVCKPSVSKEPAFYQNFLKFQRVRALLDIKEPRIFRCS